MNVCLVSRCNGAMRIRESVAFSNVTRKKGTSTRRSSMYLYIAHNIYSIFLASTADKRFTTFRIWSRSTTTVAAMYRVHVHRLLHMVHDQYTVRCMNVSFGHIPKKRLSGRHLPRNAAPKLPCRNPQSELFQQQATSRCLAVHLN
jgi:head-tail adaptor